MRLVTYDFNGSWRAGVVVENWVVDAAAAAAHLPVNNWHSTRTIIQAPLAQRTALNEAAHTLAETTPRSNAVFPLVEARLGPPVPDPDLYLYLDKFITDSIG